MLVRLADEVHTRCGERREETARPGERAGGLRKSPGEGWRRSAKRPDIYPPDGDADTRGAKPSRKMMSLPLQVPAGVATASIA